MDEEEHFCFSNQGSILNQYVSLTSPLLCPLGAGLPSAQRLHCHRGGAPRGALRHRGPAAGALAPAAAPEPRPPLTSLTSDPDNPKRDILPLLLLPPVLLSYQIGIPIFVLRYVRIRDPHEMIASSDIRHSVLNCIASVHATGRLKAFSFFISMICEILQDVTLSSFMCLFVAD